MFHILLLAVSLRRKLSLWLPWKALHISWDWTTEYIVQPQKISGNMFAWELQSSGAWQPCKWRCPSWEREFLFPRQLMWAWGWDGAWKPFASVRGAGESWGAARGCRHGMVPSLLWSKPTAGRGRWPPVPLHPAHLCQATTSKGWQQKCTNTTCASPTAPTAS